MALSFSNIISSLAVILTVVTLYPTYRHLLVWRRPTELSLATLGLESANPDKQLVVKSHLPGSDAVYTAQDILKSRDVIKPLLAMPDLKQDKFTILMPSYKRTETLHLVFKHYCTIAHDLVDQLIIIWHNMGEEVPEYLVNYECKFRITFLKQKKNSLNNRFVPYPEIKTECVLSLDDDRIISKKSLLHGFEMWKTFPHLLVGYIARIHGFNPISKSYFYRPQGVTTAQPYSITLTIAAFMHLRYLKEYTNDLPNRERDFVDTNFNCEDVFMVGVISNFLKKNDKKQCACLWVDEVAANLKHTRLGLSSDRSHYSERAHCLNLMADIYDGFPLSPCNLYVGIKY